MNSITYINMLCVLVSSYFAVVSEHAGVRLVNLFAALLNVVIVILAVGRI